MCILSHSLIALSVPQYHTLFDDEPDQEPEVINIASTEVADPNANEDNYPTQLDVPLYNEPERIQSSEPNGSSLPQETSINIVVNDEDSLEGHAL